MAVEYAHRHLDEYVCTLWAIADSREALVSGYVQIAGLLQLPEADSQDQMLAVKAVQRWLSFYAGWLLILDNADDLTMAREFIPPGKNGHIVLTSRAQVFDTIGIVQPVEVNQMSPTDARTFLLKRTGRAYEGGPERMPHPNLPQN